jgi:uroporphyrin-3 C-methyltransferase
MKTEQQQPQEVGAGTDARSSSASSVFSRVSFPYLVIGILVVVFLWQWLEVRRDISDMQQQLARKIAEIDGNTKASQILLSQSQEQVREIFSKVATLEARYAEEQNQRAALEALYKNLSVNRDETVLAEVEQLLLLAEQELQLSGNIRAALIAMQTADERLKGMNRVALSGLRTQIEHDMDKLRAMPSVDITAINSQLNDLISLVDDLPFVHQQRVATDEALNTASQPAETAWQKLLREIWLEARQLVRIENTGKAEMPLLSPEQEFYLRENLKLRLLSARLALLSRDEGGFRQEVKTAQNWVQRYFVGKSSQEVRMSEELRKLAASNISVQLPDISLSLQAVRSYRLRLEGEPGAGQSGREKARQ